MLFVKRLLRLCLITDFAYQNNKSSFVKNALRYSLFLGNLKPRDSLFFDCQSAKQNKLTRSLVLLNRADCSHQICGRRKENTHLFFPLWISQLGRIHLPNTFKNIKVKPKSSAA